VTARQRFIAAAWLLLTCVCFAVIASALWSRIDSHHSRVIKTAHGWGCVGTMREDECGPPTEIVTTPNRVPALSFFVLGGAAGLGAVVLLRRQPRPSASRDQQPASN
jgi:hypothetical protein